MFHIVHHVRIYRNCDHLHIIFQCPELLDKRRIEQLRFLWRTGLPPSTVCEFIVDTILFSSLLSSTIHTVFACHTQPFVLGIHSVHSTTGLGNGIARALSGARVCCSRPESHQPACAVSGAQVIHRLAN